MKKKLSKRFILILSSTVLLLATAITGIFAWYVDKGNFWVDSNEMTTYKEAYCNHVEYKYQRGATFAPSAYTTGNPVTAATVVPGDLVYYGFVFDLPSEDCTSALSMRLIIEVSGSGTDFFENCIIEENSLKAVTGTKSGSDPYTYTPSSTTVFLSTSNDAVNGITSTGFSMDITIPKVKDSDDSSTVYFMVYVPVWYADTDVNQNSEMGSSLSFEKIVIRY